MTELPRVAETLRADLLSFYEATDALDEIPGEIRELLEVSLCRVALRVVPELQTKAYEIVRAAEENLSVSMALHGHDLSDGEKHYEEKTSRVTKTGKKCNFNWNIPTGGTVVARRANLLESVDEKTRGGEAIFTAADSMCRTLVQYRFSHDFLMAYFARIPIDAKTEKHNFGSTFCFGCKTCPRLEKIRAGALAFATAPDSVDWTGMFSRASKHECAT